MATNSPDQKNTRMARLHANEGAKKARPVLRVIKWLFLLLFLLHLALLRHHSKPVSRIRLIDICDTAEGGTTIVIPIIP